MSTAGPLVLMALVAAVEARCGRMSLAVEPRHIGADEALRVVLRLDHLTPLGEPELVLPRGAVVASGPRSYDIALEAEDEAASSVEYAYWLAFARPGRYQIGPATVATGRGEMESRSVAVDVSGGPGPPLLRVSAALERARAFRGQTVAATFEFAYPRRLRRLRGFSIPFLSGSDGLDVLDPQDLLGRWYEAVRQTGQGLPGHRPVRVSREEGGMAIVSMSSREIDGVPHTVWSATRVLVPRRTGRFDLGRAAAAAETVVGHRRGVLRRKKPVVKALGAVSDPMTLDVVEPPRRGRPEGYAGAVGRYELVASAEPTELRVGGRPVELTLVVRGEGDLDTVGPPLLGGADDFRVGIPNEETRLRTGEGPLAGEKRFMIYLRPRSARVEAVPSAKLAVFDPIEERYVVLRTEPIPLQVAPLGAADPPDARPSPAGPGDGRAAQGPVGEGRRQGRSASPLPEIGESPEPQEAAGLGAGSIGPGEPSPREPVNAGGPRPTGRTWLFPLVALAALVALPVAAYAALRSALRRNGGRRAAAPPSPAREARARLEELAASGSTMDGAIFVSSSAGVLRDCLCMILGSRAGEAAPGEVGRLLRNAGLDREAAAEAAAILADAEGALLGNDERLRRAWLDRLMACVDRLDGRGPTQTGGSGR